MSSEPSFPLRLPLPQRLPQFRLRLRRPRLQGLPPPLRRLPLPCTSAAVLLLVVVPALLLSRWSRPRAEGLDQLMGASSLLQSFAPNPDRPVPDLWRERLGAELAQELWRRQARPWWQLWAIHSESAPFLALPAESLPALPAALSPRALRLGDLWVVAESPIAQRQLRASLRPLQRRSEGFGRRCLDRLKTSQAVYWNPQALASIVGPLAPLLDRFQSGCLSLAVEPQSVRWQGESFLQPGPGAPRATGEAAAGGRLGSPAPAGGRLALPAFDPAVPLLPQQPPLPADLLLELQGSSLELLVEGLLARDIIRDPLASRYGLDGRRLAEVRRAPFRLRLRPQPQGPFQASLELQLDPGSARATWTPVLQSIQKALVAQGFTPVAAGPELAAPTPSPPGPGAPPAAATPGPAGNPPASGSEPASAPAPAAAGGPLPPAAPPGPLPPADQPTLWRRPDGTLVGGWRWIAAASGSPQLLLFLGPPPLTPLPISRDPRQQPAPGDLWLRLQPRQMADLGLLPEEMPALLRRADQLWMDVDSPEAADSRSPVSLLTGRLQVRR